MILTNGEKMVWAAVFADAIRNPRGNKRISSRRGFSLGGAPLVMGKAFASVEEEVADVAPSAAAYACAVVRVLRTAHLEGTDDADFQMLRAMLGDEG